MDQDETWHAGRPRPWPHCVNGDSRPPPPKGHSPQLSAHICCGQMAGWIKMPLGMEVGLGPGDFVLAEDPAPLPQKGSSPNFCPCLFWPNGWMDQDGTWPWFRPHCARWGPSSPPKKGGGAPVPNFRPTSIVAKRLDASSCHLVWR